MPFRPCVLWRVARHGCGVERDMAHGERCAVNMGQGRAGDADCRGRRMGRADEDNTEIVNDQSEDMRKELDNIYRAIAACRSKRLRPANSPAYRV